MSASFADRSSDTSRETRDVVLTATVTVGDDFYKAKSLWVNPTTPPQTGTTTEWAVEE